MATVFLFCFLLPSTSSSLESSEYKVESNNRGIDSIPSSRLNQPFIKIDIDKRRFSFSSDNIVILSRQTLSAIINISPSTHSQTTTSYCNCNCILYRWMNSLQARVLAEWLELLQAKRISVKCQSMTDWLQRWVREHIKGAVVWIEGRICRHSYQCQSLTRRAREMSYWQRW